MKGHTYMAEKYALANFKTLESLFPVPDEFVCHKACRYGDGYVYRVIKKWTIGGEPPWRGYLYFYSVNKKVLYKTETFDQIKIHMTDFEHGCPYATGFEFSRSDNWTRVDCTGEVWCDSDLNSLVIEGYTIAAAFNKIRKEHLLWRIK